MRVRLPSAHCKPTAPSSRRHHERPDRRIAPAAIPWMVSLWLAATLTGCAGFGTRTIALATLEQAPSAPMLVTQRIVLRDTRELGSCYHPLEPRLGLITVRSRGEWDRLAGQSLDDIGPCPDFSRGSVVGLVCLAGLPLEGDWPIRIDSVRIHQGAGLVEAGFRGGTYLPDGTTYVTAAYIPDLRQVLVVDVNGLKYTPAQ